MPSALLRSGVLVAAVAASVASAPPEAQVVGALADRELTLEPDTARTFSFGAVLHSGGPGAGQLTLTCVNAEEAAPDEAGAFRLRIASDSTGEASEVDVLDTADQPETSLSIAAFAGCTSGACEEKGTLAFERTDGPGAPTLSMVWRLDATFTPDSGDVEDNDIVISVDAVD